MSPKRLLVASACLLTGSVLMCNGIQAKNAEHAKASKPKIDLAFCIDTTGSMQSEIDVVKTKTKEIVAKLSGSKPSPEIRVGLVAYRDRGDEYVTKVFQFSGDVDQVVKDISSLQANGGGDEPEAVNEALHAAVHDLQWSADKKAVKLLFLIGDAGPKRYPGDYSWESESKKAISNGIQINTIACGNMSLRSTAHDVFEKIAKLSDGKSEFLTYKQDVVDARTGKHEMLVASGGKTYKLSKPSSYSWRAGADSLMAKGALAPVPSASASSYTSSVSSGYLAGAAAGASADGASGLAYDLPAPGAPTARVAGTLRRASRASAPSASYGAAFGGSVSRAESNLDDIVLGATKEAARKKANIEYK